MMPDRPDIEPQDDGEEKTNQQADSSVNTGGERGNHVDDVAPEAPQADAEPLDVSALSEADIAEMAAAAAECAALKDKFLRARAELDNYRKRAQRDVEIASGASLMGLARLLLPVLDNFDRALESAADDHKKFKSFYKGIVMIEQQLYKALEDGGVRRIEAEGRPFDPNYHEAVSVMNDPSKPDDTIVAVVEKGYVYKDMVVRPAKVVISKQA